MKTSRFGAWLLAGVSMMAVASGAQAQSDSQTLDEVVITGSRIIRNGDTMPSPVTVVASEDILQVQPGTLSDALNILPVFAGSRSTTSNPSSNGSQTGGNGNSNQLNLRNLGVTRTLVLMDGYRLPPTSFNNVVDVDIVPQMLVQRVDTVTGGVSAVYGSDAVAGVVNYIINKNFNGLRIEADAGVSQRGDDQRYSIGIAGGRKLGDRGHIEASYQYIDEGGIDARSQRPWIHNWGFAGAGTAANPYILYPDVHQSGFAFGGLINQGVLSGQHFAEDGVLRRFAPGQVTPSAALQSGGDGAFYDSQLAASLKAHQVFVRYDHELTDNLSGYVQVSGNFKTNETEGDPLQYSNFTFQAANPYLPQVYRAQLAAAGQSTFRMSQLFGNYTRLQNVAESEQLTFSAGLDGSLGEWNWGVNLSRGQANLETTLPNNVNRQRLAAALDVVVNPATGQPVCNITLTNPALADGCVPLNVFGPTAAANSAGLAYVLQPTVYSAETIQDNLSAHISGTAFTLPAGDVGVALSAEWRKLSFSSSTTGASTTLVNCTGIRTNCTPGQGLWAFGFAGSPEISNTVKEGALEVNVPLLKDVPFIQSASINAAARFTSYETSGDYWTWKIGGDWHVNDQLRFRATRSRDIRAPTLYELFGPLNSVPVQPVDLLTGLSPTVPSSDRSNPNLTAEIGNTFTAGFTWTPMAGLSITLDAYTIEITDAIVTASGSNPSYQRLCYASGGSSEFCALQARPLNYTNTTAANAVTGWFVDYKNIASIETEGADLEINYTRELFARPANFRLLTAYQPHAYYRAPGVPTIDQGGVAFGPTGYSAGATWRVAAFARVSPIENLTVDLLHRWRRSMKYGGDESIVIQNNKIDAFQTTNVTLTYNMKTVAGDTQVFGNVSNLFDSKAPGGAYTGNGTRSGLRDGFVPGDDVVGRAFSLGVRIRR